MHILIEEWLGREFVTLAAEGRANLDAAGQTEELVARFDGRLLSLGLSLDNTVRTRLWGRDRESRDLGSRERVRLLGGTARSVSSSYISPEHFDSEARVALDLVAMRPSAQAETKKLVEYDPPIVPLRYLVYDTVVFLSGVTSELPTLQAQLADILPRIGGSLADAGVSWNEVVGVSSYLHTSQRLGDLKRLLAATVPLTVDQRYGFADGYSSPGKLVEIEVTARLSV
jgi:enamine deaminase RidA (YjgF/YER057c/UK114 family)